MTKGVSISYGDIALGAKENFVPTANQIEPFSDPLILQKNNLEFTNYGNPIEKYSVLLDGSASPFPSDVSDKRFGIWSDIISDENGYFETPILISFRATELYTSSGITIAFDEKKDIFPVEVVASWYRNDEKILEKTFYPNSAKYFFNQKVEFYNGLDIKFIRLNMPQNRLRVYSIDYGVGVIFYGDELKSVKISQTLNPISSQIEINTCDFVVHSRKNIEYSFKTQQPISVYFNGDLKSTCFVKSARRNSRKVWSVNAEDYIGLMDTIPYYGGVYFDEDADKIIKDIFRVAKISYTLSDELVGAKVSGYIPYTNCRNALMQVAFAIGAVVDTSNSNIVNIFSLSKEISQLIPKERIMLGQTSSEKNVVTSVELISHSYEKSQEEMIVFEATQKGTGKNVLVKFDQPLYDLSIVNGEIITSGANYAIINANDGCIVTGKKYTHTTVSKLLTNPLITSSDIENTVSVKNATLVSSNNVDKILNLCYNYIVNSNEFNLRIVDGKHIKEGLPIKYGMGLYYGDSLKYGQTEKNKVTYDKPTKVGDLITLSTEFSGDLTGRIVKQSYSLLGGIIVKDTVMR